MKTNAAIVDLNGRKWQPFESATPTGFVTYTENEGEIHVPYGKDPVSRTIQAHELSHVRYTSRLWPDAQKALKRLTALAGTTNAIVGYAEDMRITALAGRLGVKTLPVFGNTEDKAVIDRWVDSFVNAGVPAERVQKAVQFILNAHTTVLKHIGLTLDTLQQRANAERYIVHCAQHLHNLLSRGDEGESGSSSPDQSDDKSDQSDKSDDNTSSDSTPGEKSEQPEESDDKSDDDDKGDDKSSKSDKSEDEGDEGQDNDTSEDGDQSEDSDEDNEDDDTSDKGDPAEDGNGDNDDTSDPSDGEPSEDTGGASRERKDPEVLDLSDLNLPDLRQAMLQSVPAPVDTQKLIQEFQHTLDTGDWIPVPAIERKPLVRRAAQARNRGRKLSEVGVVLGSAYDAVSPNERRPFTAKRKGGTGGLTVVIDCSGSMAISDSQLEQLLTAHPQGVVVTYSSFIVPRKRNEDKAVVRVIASHGRLAAGKDFRDRNAGGNGCDGPVLEWLAKQSGERVWICDGCITGHGDNAVSHSWEARDAWLKAHRITQYTSLGDYLSSLTRKG